MKVVISNSVGRDYQGNHYIHFPSRYTARVGKVKNWTFYPYELAYLSSLLKKETRHKIKMVDPNLLQLNPKQAIELIKKEKPDWLIMETATILYPLDLEVAVAIKKEFGTKIVFTGQHPTAYPEKVLSDGADYVCIGEYEMTVLDLIKGKNPKRIAGLYPNSYRELLDVNALPFPEDKDISRWDYINIGGCDYKEIMFYSTRGCPRACNYCVCGNMTYKKPNWRPRKVNSIIEEIKYLRKKYPQMEGAMFYEEYQNVKKDFMLELTSEIVKNKLNDLKYYAMCGYWTLDKEVLTEMKNAGYYKIEVGIETASPIIAKHIGKNMDLKKLRQVLRWAKEVGLKTYGTFMFGAKGSNAKEDMKTIRLMKELIEEGLLDDYQSSIAIPQPGTPFFKWADKNKYIITYDWQKYNGGCAVVSYPRYPAKEIEKIYRLTTTADIYLDLQLRRHGGAFNLFLFYARKLGVWHTTKLSLRTVADRLHSMLSS